MKLIVQHDDGRFYCYSETDTYHKIVEYRRSHLLKKLTFEDLEENCLLPDNSYFVLDYDDLDYDDDVRQIVKQTVKELTELPTSLTFDHFQKVSEDRNEQFCDYADNWVAENWSNALAGEVGELCNWIKKLDRINNGHTPRKGDPQTSCDILEKIEEEIGDIQSYLSLLSSYFDINLANATRSKFNKVSDRFKCDIKL